jgi:protein-disulfide isomerase
VRYPFAILLLFSALVFSACGDKNTASATGSESAGAKGNHAQVKGDESCGVGLAIAPDTTVATINGVVVKCSELMARGKAQLMGETIAFDQRIHSLHEQNLTELINDEILQAAADEAGLPIEKFVATNVIAEPITTEEMRAFYDQAVAAGEPLPDFAEVEDELEKFMIEQKQKAALSAFRADLRAKATIEVDMPILLPPKVSVEAIGNARGGPASAPVTIVEFSDFECGFCQKAEPIIERVLETYGDKVRLVYRDYPLPNHTLAPKAAEATHCAQLQGKYWEMHGALFADQSKLGIGDLKAHAAALGLEQAAFDACLDSGQTQATVLASLKAGAELGVSGTPAFFINGRLVSGAQPFERFKELIDHELSAN